MISTLQDTFLLNDGKSIPGFGFGCWGASGDTIQSAVEFAIESGYRYIDSAARYLNEADVGVGITASHVKREDIFLLSKLWPTAFDDPACAIEHTLRDLKTDYLDAYLLHWPGTDTNRRLRVTEMVLKYRDKQKIKTIGVSNYQIKHLAEFKKQFGFFPSINQIELHPFYQERELAAFCRENNICLIAWGPLYRARLMDHEVITALSRQNEKSPAQILLRWHVQKGHVVIPKSEKQARIIENANIFDFTLSNKEMETLDALDCGMHIGADPYTYNGEISK